MPLPKPSLDTRGFLQLAEEVRALLPDAAPQWTDHNLSNTGTTLLELLAWLCEMDLYRLDRTTDEAIRAYLRLVGIEPFPVRVARTVLGIDAGIEAELPAGLQLCAPVAGGAPIVFQTTEAITVGASRLVRVLAGDGIDATARNAAVDAPWWPFGQAASDDAALYLGFDAPLASPGKTVCLQVWTCDPVGDAALRDRLVSEYASALADRGRTCAATLRDLPPWWLHYQLQTRWEYLGSEGNWQALAEVVDHTRALSLSGPVRFRIPADHVPGGPAPGLFFVRCRLLSGGVERATPLANVVFNAVMAEHAIDRRETLGRSQGRALERHPISQPAAIPGSTHLDQTGGMQPPGTWREVTAWDVSGPHDMHYRLDRDLGRIEFGDGRRGLVPPAGEQFELAYRTGGDSVGNVPPRSLERWLDNAHNQALLPGWPAVWPALSLRQHHAGFGGAPAEPLRAAVARAIADTRRASVALTLEDFQRLACDVPGVPVARARAIADRDPSLPAFVASGDVSIVVIPEDDGPRPLPSAGMRAAVARHLARWRSPATRLHVLAPAYREVTVVARLHAAADADRDRLLADALAATDRFLHPIRGGPDHAGWPAGRTVHRSELLAMLAALPGVQAVTDLGLQGEDDVEPRCGNLPLCDDQLPTPGKHRFTLAAAPAPRIIDRSHSHECP